MSNLKQEREHQAKIAKQFLKEHKAKCIGCGAEFDAGRDWKVRKYCSNPCYQKTQKGRVQTPEARRNIVRALKENAQKKTPESTLRGVETRRRNGFPQYRPEVRAKISATLKGHRYTPRGEKNPLWRGTRQLRELLWCSAEYKEWRSTIFERDNYTCQLCGIKNREGLGRTVTLHVDHYPVPLREYTDRIVALSPGLSIHQRREIALKTTELWDTDNGRTLCVECHKRTPTWGRPKKLQGVTI